MVSTAFEKPDCVGHLRTFKEISGNFFAGLWENKLQDNLPNLVAHQR